MACKPIRYLATSLALLALCGAASAQDLVLEDCRISAGPGHAGIKARCGTMLRPENPADPDSPDIELRVAVVPALNLNPEPTRSCRLPAALARARSSSTPAAGARSSRCAATGTYCSSTSAAPVSRLAWTVRSTTMPFCLNRSSRSTIPCSSSEDCLEELPHDPRYFTTSVAVTDLEAVRVCAGLFDTQSLRRVLRHARRAAFRASLSRFNPHRRHRRRGAAANRAGPEIATESQMAVDNILARCAEDAACNERFPDIAATFARFVAELREAPSTCTYRTRTPGVWKPSPSVRASSPAPFACWLTIRQRSPCCRCSFTRPARATGCRSARNT